MFRFGFIWRLLFALLVIGVLAAGGTALFRAGWAQGYQVGAVATAPGGGEAAPAIPYYYPPYAFYPPYGFHPFGLFGLVFGFFLIFFLFGGLFRLMGGRRWAGHPGYGDWGHGPVPPWAKEWHERYHTQPEKGEGPKETPEEK